MKEKKRTEKENPIGGDGGSVFDNLTPGVVHIGSGPYAEDLPVAGKTVGEIRQKYSDRYDINPQSVAIINGKPAGEDSVLMDRDTLLFIHHAGEKGVVTLEGSRARVDGKSMPITEMLARCQPGINTGGVLPNGVKAVLSQGPVTLWFWEQPPQVRQLSWIRSDSPKPYGPGTKYRKVSIALPYLVIVSAFILNGGQPILNEHAECFFRTKPLTHLGDELLFPALLNCSRWSDVDGMCHPLSWICTQYLKEDPKMSSGNPELMFQGGMEAVRYCLLETSFNLSSEHHEGNSWYNVSKTVDPRIATIEEWEKNTRKDPLFVLDVPWIPTKHTVQQLADRKFKQLAPSSAGLPKTADDIARIIRNAS